MSTTTKKPAGKPDAGKIRNLRKAKTLLGVAITLPKQIIGEYKKYADHYEVPLASLIASNAWDEAMALKDCVWEYLERMDQMPVSPTEAPVILEYSIEVYNFLNRIAEITRRPLTELLRCLAFEGGEILGRYFDEYAKENDLLNPDVVCYAESAATFQRFAKAGKLPPAIKEISPWDFYGLDEPEEQASGVERGKAA